MVENSLKYQKTALRSAIFTKRSLLSTDERKRFSATICEKIMAQTPIDKAKTVAAFAPTAFEVDIFPVINALQKKDITVALPRIVGKGLLCFHQFLGQPELVESCFPGFFEPKATAPIIDINTFDYLLIPAVAIDKNFNRLGYGGGFYDRFLPKLVSVYSCVPIFSCQRTETVPVEAHDYPVDIALSE